MSGLKPEIEASSLKGAKEKNVGAVTLYDKPGVKMPIVFLHASGLCSQVFEPQFEDENLAQHRLIAIDLPGHGASQNAQFAQKSYTTQRLAQTVRSTLNDLQIKECILVGWSLGGQIAYEFLDETSCVKGIVTIGAVPCYRGGLGVMMGFDTFGPIRFSNRPQHQGAEAQKLEDLVTNNKGQGRYIEAIERIDPRFRSALTKDAMFGKGKSHRKALEKAKIPVKILCGKEDPFIRINYLEGLSGPTLYQGGCQILEGISHAPNMEAPELINNMIYEFAHTVIENYPISQAPKLKRA